MERCKARQPGRPLVELRVELHRARAQRIEARVDRVVELREVDVVAHDLRLVELRQRRRRRPTRRRRNPLQRVLRRMRDLAAAAARSRPFEDRRLELVPDDAHLDAPVAADFRATARRPSVARSAPAPASTPTGGRPDLTSSSALANCAISSLVVTSVAQTRRASASDGSSGSASARARPARTPRSSSRRWTSRAPGTLIANSLR